MRIIFFICISFGLIACTSMNNYNLTSSNWRGKPADLLIQKQGAPKAIMPAVNGNTLFVYVTEAQAPSPSSANSSTMVVSRGKTIATNQPLQPANRTNTFVSCMTTFEVDKQHMIVSVASKGVHC